jgi:colanic acid/amylovoran biosynthesis glycosyltransferase
MKIAYIGWNIPTVATFVVSEIKNVLEKGVKIVLIPIRLNKGRNIQSDFEEVYRNIQDVPYFFSFKVWFAILFFLFSKPLKLIGTVAHIMYKCRKPLIYLAKTSAIIPKSIYFAYDMRHSDVDFVFATWAHYPATMAYIIKALTGKKYAFSAHAGADIYRFPVFLKEKIEQADFVTTCVAANKDFLVSLCGQQHAAKIHVNYHGVNLSKFKPDPNAGRFQHNQINILSVGNLHAPKGFIYMIRALRILLDSGSEKPFKYTIVGTGYEQDNLNAEIEKLNLQNYVEFKSEVSQKELVNIYNKTDIFVMPSILHESGGRDGVPNVLVEALSLGVPSVGSNISGLPEAIKHKETGMLVEQRSPEQLAEAILYMVKNPQEACNMGEKAVEFVNKTFDKSKKFEELYAIMKGYLPQL